MSNETLLKLSAVFFAVIWTAMMIWWTDVPLQPAPLAIFVIIGALTGLGWYWLYGKWFRWYLARR